MIIYGVESTEHWFQENVIKITIFNIAATLLFEGYISVFPFCRTANYFKDPLTCFHVHD